MIPKGNPHDTLPFCKHKGDTPKSLWIWWYCNQYCHYHYHYHYYNYFITGTIVAWHGASQTGAFFFSGLAGDGTNWRTPSHICRSLQPSCSKVDCQGRCDLHWLKWYLLECVKCPVWTELSRRDNSGVQRAKRLNSKCSGLVTLWPYLSSTLHVQALIQTSRTRQATRWSNNNINNHHNSSSSI